MPDCGGGKKGGCAGKKQRYMEKGLGNREIKNEKLTATVLKTLEWKYFSVQHSFDFSFYNVIYLHVVDSMLTDSYTPVKV